MSDYPFLTILCDDRCNIAATLAYEYAVNHLHCRVHVICDKDEYRQDVLNRIKTFGRDNDTIHTFSTHEGIGLKNGSGIEVYASQYVGYRSCGATIEKAIYICDDDKMEVIRETCFGLASANSKNKIVILKNK